MIFDVGDIVLENASTLSLVLGVPCSCLRVTIYLPGRGFSARDIRKRGEGAARAGRVQRARATSWEQNIFEELATGDHRERTEHGGINAERNLPKGWKRARKGQTWYLSVRNYTRDPP